MNYFILTKSKTQNNINFYGTSDSWRPFNALTQVIEVFSGEISLPHNHKLLMLSQYIRKAYGHKEKNILGLPEI